MTSLSISLASKKCIDFFGGRQIKFNLSPSDKNAQTNTANGSKSWITNSRLYTSREYDQELDLYYYRGRTYDARIGRFIQRDPIGYADDVNLYTYVGNNPMNYTDPWGLKAKKILDKKIKDLQAIIKAEIKNIPWGWKAIHGNTVPWLMINPKTTEEKQVELLVDNYYMKGIKYKDDLEKGKISAEAVVVDMLVSESKLEKDAEQLCINGNNHPFCKEYINQYRMGEYLTMIIGTLEVAYETMFNKVGTVIVKPKTMNENVGSMKVTVKAPTAVNRELVFDKHIEASMKKRPGWSKEKIIDVVNGGNYKFIRSAIDKTTLEPATAYFISENQYVVVNNINNRVVQVSDLNNPNRIVDSTIK